MNLTGSGSMPAKLGGTALAFLRKGYLPLMRKLYRAPLGPPLSLLYRGDRVECPCCGRSFRKFMPTIREVGPNASNDRCPNCGARERHRHLWLYLANRTNLLTDRIRVLHFAPERTLERRLKAQPNLDYISTDLERPTAMVKADITDLPFPADSFDMLLCSHVLEHVVDDRKAMRELHRVLKPDGQAILLVPISSRRAETFEDPTIVAPEDRQRAFGQHDHVRIYGRDFPARLEDAGFSVSVVDYAGELGEERARRYGLRPRKRPYLHVCRKS